MDPSKELDTKAPLSLFPVCPLMRTQYSISDCFCSLLISYDVKREKFMTDKVRELENAIEIQIIIND